MSKLELSLYVRVGFFVSKTFKERTEISLVTGNTELCSFQVLLVILHLKCYVT